MKLLFQREVIQEDDNYSIVKNKKERKKEKKISRLIWTGHPDNIIIENRYTKQKADLGFLVPEH